MSIAGEMWEEEYDKERKVTAQLRERISSIENTLFEAQQALFREGFRSGQLRKALERIANEEYDPMGQGNWCAAIAREALGVKP